VPEIFDVLAGWWQEDRVRSERFLKTSPRSATLTPNATLAPIPARIY